MDWDKFASILTQEVDPLLNGHVLNDPLTELSDPDSLAAMYVILQALRDEVEGRKEVIRLRLLHKAEKLGKLTDHQGQRLLTEYGTVQRERREGKLPEESAMRLLLAAHNLPLEAAFTEKKQMVFDPSKVAGLVARGEISEESVVQCRKVSWALKVKPSRAVRDIMELDDEDEDL
jgi:hypothetical protein